MESHDNWDIIIVGAGILGTAIGKTILEEDKNLSILIIDKYPAAGQGNTSKSNACFRNVFSTIANIKLSKSSIEYYKHLQDEKGINLDLQEFGYLWLLSESNYQSWNENNIQTEQGENISFLSFLRRNNVEFDLFDQNKLKEILPELSLTFENEDMILPLVNVEYGLLGRQCGALSPDLLVKTYEKMFISDGGTTSYNTEVIEILFKEKEKDFNPEFQDAIWKDTEVAGLKVIKNKEEKIILADQIILATGAWIQQLLDPLGIDSRIRPKKRQLFRLCDLDNFVQNDQFPTEIDSIPFLILPVSGIFLKPVLGANCVVVGCSDDIGRRFETRTPRSMSRPTEYNQYLDDPKGEEDFYIYNLLPVLNSYLPNIIDEFTQIHTPSAGMYAYSPDKNPIISKFKKLDNLIICSGASGSGIMKADAIARITSGLYQNKKQVTLFDGSTMDVDQFGLIDRKLPVETAIL